LNLNSILI